MMNLVRADPKVPTVTKKPILQSHWFQDFSIG